MGSAKNGKICRKKSKNHNAGEKIKKVKNNRKKPNKGN